MRVFLYLDERSMVPKTLPSSSQFSVDKFKRDFNPLQLSEFEFEKVGMVQLPSEALFCLNYMADIEWSIGIYARNALVTRFSFDPEFCEFLPRWMIEEYGHRDLLNAYLDAYYANRGEVRPLHIHSSYPNHKKLIPTSQSVGWASMGILGHVMPTSLEILYLSWGTVNEYLTAAGYRILASKVGCTILQAILWAIEPQEYKHGHAYRQMAADRINQNLRVARINRVLLERQWKMVGVGIRPSGDALRVAQYLCQAPGDYAVLERHDKTIGRIAGLEGINLLQRTATRAGYVA